MADANMEADEVEDGERPVHARANRNLYRVVPVRLPTDKWELIRKEANDLGIGPTTLARIWILDSLRWRLVDDTSRQPQAEKSFAAKQGQG